MRYAIAAAAAPDAVACGALDDAVQIRAIASHIDGLRESGAASLVLDDVPHRGQLGAVGDAARAMAHANVGEPAERLFRDVLLPRADLVVCALRAAQTGRDARRAPSGDLESRVAADTIAAAPALARRLRDAGAIAVCVIGMRAAEGHTLAWLDTDEAQGWLTGPYAGASLQRDWSSHDGAASDGSADRERFAQQLAAALARAFVAADAAVLATLAEAAAWRADAATREPQTHLPAALRAGAADQFDLPLLSWGEVLAPSATPTPSPGPRRSLGLYAIVDSAERLLQVLQAGVQTVQLRIKTPASPGPEWTTRLRGQVQRSIAASRAADAELFINDHWMLAHELGASGVHLGQEDLLTLGESGRGLLRASGLALGISSHSLWELCRAAGLRARYIACGPVWPTLTKAMPWRAQGLDNLAWWCRMAPAPVVAIGGVLDTQRMHDAAACGADGVCVVRGLGKHPLAVVPALQAALKAGRTAAGSASANAGASTAAAWPHPSLLRARQWPRAEGVSL